MTHTPASNPILPLSDYQLAQLTRDLNGARVAKLDKGRTKLSYVEAWDIKATLIRIFGFGGFSAEAEECEIVRIENDVPKTDWVEPAGGGKKEKVELPVKRHPDGSVVFNTANFRVTVRVRVKLTIHQLGAVYSEWAAASQTGPDVGEVTDFAIKTAESDALKRAAIYLGTQFGLSLYNSGALEDVVKTVLAPGQEWSRGYRVDPATGKPLVPTGTPAAAQQGAAGSVVHARGEGMTDDERAAATAQLETALSAKKTKASNTAPADAAPEAATASS